MKKLSFVFALIFLLAIPPSYAQPFGGGLRAGMNASQIAGDGMSGYHKAGFSGGFLLYYYTSADFRLQFELGYTRKGSARQPDPEDPAIRQFLRQLNYVEMPLLTVFGLGKLEAEAGLSADWLTHAGEKIDGYPNNNFNLADWRKICFNSVLGLRYRLSEHFVVFTRSTNSLHSIRKNSVPGNVRRFSRKFGEYNDVLSFGLSWEMNRPSAK
ncbi:MAG: outer membrane beta-barrel protein [Bacteroidetes bacterium]|nr:outer membrane beta-barrel protein [Bacteroidota bacterium]